MNRTIAIGAGDYLESVEFSGIRVGDTIVLDHDDSRWNINNRFTVEAVEDGAVRIKGAWYRKADGWTTRIVITPETIEVKEPYDTNWARCVGGAGNGGEWQIMIRATWDADTMIKIGEVHAYDKEHGFAQLQAFGGQIKWTAFARAMYRIGLDNLFPILEPFHQAGWDAIKGRTFYEMGDDVDAMQVEMAKAIFSSYSFQYGANDIGYDERMYYWILSLASYYSNDGKALSYDDTRLLVDNLGSSLYLEYAFKRMPIEDMRSLAIQIRDNDIDTELVKNLMEPKLPEGVEWM